jgi:hypothetical protein
MPDIVVQTAILKNVFYRIRQGATGDEFMESRRAVA